ESAGVEPALGEPAGSDRVLGGNVLRVERQRLPVVLICLPVVPLCAGHHSASEMGGRFMGRQLRSALSRGRSLVQVALAKRERIRQARVSPPERRSGPDGLTGRRDRAFGSTQPLEREAAQSVRPVVLGLQGGRMAGRIERSVGIARSELRLREQAPGYFVF